MKIAVVSLSKDFEKIAAELTERLRKLGHAVEWIRFPLTATPRGRLATKLIRFDTGGSDLTVIADNVKHTGDWEDAIRRVLSDRSLGTAFPAEAPISEEESLALADSVSAILAELGSNEMDKLADKMSRRIAELGHFPNANV